VLNLLLLSSPASAAIYTVDGFFLSLSKLVFER
jgi:hypothetical protein